jgi:hypothetical protein
VVVGLRLPLEARFLGERVRVLNASPHLEVQRQTKGQVRALELRACLGRLEASAVPPDDDGRPLVLALLAEREGGMRLKPTELIALLGCEPARCRITRIVTLAQTPAGLAPMCAHLDILDQPGNRATRGVSRLDPGVLAALVALDPRFVLPATVFSQAQRE